MKTKSLMFAALVTMVIVAMASCNNTNNPEGENTRVSDLTMLKYAFFRVDSVGNITAGPNLGKALHEETPNVYYVGVTDVKNAKEIFLGFVDKQISVIEDGDNLTLDLKDGKGNAEGKVEFKAVSNSDEGILAEVSFPETPELKGLAKLVFIENGRWPENAGSKYKLWKTVRVPDAGAAYPLGICIREWSAGNNGIILCPTKNETERKQASSNCSLETMAAWSKYMRDSQFDFTAVNNVFTSAGLNTLDKYYWSKDIYDHVFWENRYAIKLSTGDEERHSSGGSGKAYNFLGYWFNENGDCW